jgi:glycosyltransferase involved in cell wall biosynthesis
VTSVPGDAHTALGASPAVSVIIPVYNCERYLAEAIRSVLAQTSPPLEVIVVDDASADGSASVAQSFGAPVRYSLQPKAGAGAARNRGAELARGSHFAFLDADDLWVPDKLRLQLDTLAASPELDAVFGYVRQFRSPELGAEVATSTKVPTEPIAGYHAGTMLIRREAFTRVGPFETGWQVGEFVSWYLRASELGLRMRMLPEVVMERRVHDTNTVIRERNAYTQYVRVLKAALDRRRAAEGAREDSGDTAP